MKVGNNDAISIVTLFTGNLQYWVPRYQRRYIWDETNWKALWRDIERLLRVEAKDKLHFTGSIVTRPDETESALEKREIIDGQQRLTTFQIIFCVIRDIAVSPAYKDSGIKSKIQSIVELPEYDANKEKARIEQMTGDNIQDEFSPCRLVPKGHDRDILQSLLIERRTSDQHSGISRAYDYFKGVIIAYLKQEGSSLENLLDVLSGNFHIIPIELELEDEPEKIFESVNDTGRALDEFDYLWNHLFLRARKMGERRSNELYDLHWKKFEEELFWDSVETREMFFRKFLMAKRGPECFEKTSKAIKAFDLYREYSNTLANDSNYVKTCKDEPGLDQVEYEFRQLSRYADSYQKLYDPSQVSEDSEELRKFGSRMQFDNLNLQNLDSFILFLVHEAEPIDGNFFDVFEILESYIVRRMLCAKRNEDIYTQINAFFSQSIKTPKFKVSDLANALYGTWPDSEQVERALEQAWSKDDNLILYVLYGIELHKGGPKNFQLGFNNLQGPEPIVDRLFLHDNYHAADSIGNLMPLILSPEDGLRTSPFDMEKKMHLEALAEDLVLTREICVKENWTTAEIADRAANLFVHFEQIWKPVAGFVDDI